MKPKPFEIIVEFTPQSTKTGVTYEMHQKGSLIRCKDCKNWVYGFIDGQDNFIPPHCGTYRRLVGYSADDYCSLAERKEE